MSHIRFSLFVFALLLWNISFAQPNEESRGFVVNLGDKVQDIPLYMSNGDTISLSELQGKVVVLQFTASWCSVCRKEMPHLENEVWLPNKDNDFVLIGVDIDKDVSKVAPFIESMQVSYPIAIDENQSIFYKFAATGAGVTRNVVIDKTGEIVFLTRLFDSHEFELMKNKIASLLK